MSDENIHQPRNEAHSKLNKSQGSRWRLGSGTRTRFEGVKGHEGGVGDWDVVRRGLFLISRLGLESLWMGRPGGRPGPSFNDVAASLQAPVRGAFGLPVSVR